ncbi:MAG: RNase adapter RapZ [Erythrobacter sp.]
MSSSTRIPTPSDKQSILLVTGLSGAGKSTALQVLEDLGWETIDNFPVRLLKSLLSNPDQQDGPLAIGFDSRTRGFVPHDVIELVKDLTDLPQIQLTTLFIDCSSGELERRYNETRRRHPMAQGRPLQDGIRAERELLEPMRRWADMVVDTSSFATNELQQHVRELFGTSAQQPMTVTVSSFGFARGMPPLADLVFDMRFLDNPHWIDGLRELTGLDEPVAAHIKKDAGFAPVFDRIAGLISDLLPRYAAQGKSYVHIALGCTGGRHRSVFTAEQVAQNLRDQGFSPTVRHRNLGSRATDAIEQMKL